MPTRKALGRMAVVTGTAVAALVAGAGPAHAATRSFDTGYVGSATSVGLGSGWGQITWLNRSVQVNGTVDDHLNANYYSQVIFEAWGGTKRVDRQTRSVNNGRRGYGFTLDGSAYRGGITRVKIDACVFRAGSNTLWGCAPTAPVNLYRPR
ncbi:hypothetical protein RB614_36330 [Phytohabitans sp. ZYX-F-186]|uniref:Secreted protein n=1 Tax=Phytohabitans maris TaxID=3071409 RepID=A0ABU0ZUX2_9ACTN|nr:hypothetical protein [Phytohabitans sp. ZYX-F-186]MDQ7909980.1 hypothetical protein [Phytohabitans sp. ZYX-F-186]